MTTDISPSFGSLRSAAQELTVPYVAGERPLGASIGGLSMFSSEFRRGSGDKVFGVNEKGMWFGSANYETAPIRFDFDGNAYFQSPSGNIQIDTVNSRILVFDQDGIPRVLVGRQENGF